MAGTAYQWLHGRFLLDCTPRPVTEGVFVAYAEACSSGNEQARRTVVPVPAQRFASEREAAMHALKTAVRWADSQH